MQSPAWQRLSTSMLADTACTHSYGRQALELSLQYSGHTFL